MRGYFIDGSPSRLVKRAWIKSGRSQSLKAFARRVAADVHHDGCHTTPAGQGVRMWLKNKRGQRRGLDTRTQFYQLLGSSRRG